MIAQQIRIGRKLHERYYTVSLYLCVTVLLVALAVLAGWHWDIGFLRHPIEGTVSMNPITACAFVLIALWLIANIKQQAGVDSGWRRMLFMFGAWILVLTGSVSLLDRSGLMAVGLDQILWADKLGLDTADFPFNRVAPNTALGLFLVGFSLLCLQSQSRRVKNIANILAQLVFVLGLVSCIGYLYGAHEFYRVGHSIPMSLLTSLCFVCIALALLFQNPHVGFMNELFKATGGGRVARYLLPTSIIVPIVLGYGRMKFQEFYPLEVGLGRALFVVTIILVFTAMVRFVSRLLNATDEARIESETALRKLNEELEERILQRASELASAERRFQVLVENSQESISLNDVNGKLLYLSPSAHKNSGADPSSRVGVSMLEKIHEEDKSKAILAWQAAVKNVGVPQKLTHRLWRADGSLVWVEGALTCFQKENGEREVVTNFHDITRQKEYELLLRKQNALLSTLSSTAKIGGWDFTMDPVEFSWTDEMYVIHELPIGKKPSSTEAVEYFAPEAQPVIRSAMQECREKGIAFDVELPFIGALGAEKRVRVLGRAEKLDGKVVRVYGTMQDVTEKTRVEHTLARAINEVQDYKAALNESSIVAITDPKGKILHVNENFCRISKYTAQELIGKDHRIINSGYHPKEFFRELWRTIASGRVWHGEIRNRAKDGTLYWVDTTIVPFLNEESKPYEYLAIRADITERKEAEEKVRQYLEELERSNRDLEQFAYIASHDLQEPLRMVGSYMDLIRRRYGPALDADGREFIEYAVDGATRMKQLITDLLQFSRINRQGVQSMVDVTSVVQRSLHHLQSRVEETGAHIEVGDMPQVFAEESQLIQLFQNLIGNALKFSREGVQPRVVISATSVDNGIQFSVKDNGIGIEARFADKIFIIFRQLHDKSRYPGTGIGLAIAKRIVERYGGKIWFESVYGQGTTFHFTIPRGDE